MTYINVKVDLEEIYDDLSRNEKMNLVGWLGYDGLIDGHCESSNTINDGLINGEFMESCVKLGRSYYQMSQEDVNLIIGLVKKYS